MAVAGLESLHGGHQALEQRTQTLARLQEHLDEYKCTLGLTKELPARVKHSIMVRSPPSGGSNAMPTPRIT